MRTRMQIPSPRNVLLASLLLVLALVAAGCGGELAADEPAASGEADGPAGASSKTGQALADEIMAQWKREHPGREWVEVEKQKHHIEPPFDNLAVLRGEQGDGHVYGDYTRRDLEIWDRELEKLVVEGSMVFHSADLLGGTVGVSCDMCHPDGANTHPETYPKFQTQMGRVALLRDMINWCIQQPVRGERLDPDDPRMRALEAYVYAQRKGVELAYGKH